MSRQHDAAHRAAQDALATGTADALAMMILGLEEPRQQAAMDAYNARSWRLVAGAQHRSAQLALGYMTLVVGRGRAPAPTAAAAIADVQVSPVSPVARSPMLRLWHLIDSDVEVGEAKTAASSYADELASTDLHVAQRAGLDAGARTGARSVAGWRKDLSADACEWCRLVSDRVYRTSSVPFHARDRCSVSPVFDDEAEWSAGVGMVLRRA